jgi:hypothetical protein
MLPTKDTILNKVYNLRRHESTTDSKTSTQPAVRRRAAVFDHHDVHPDWASESSVDDATAIDQGQKSKAIDKNRQSETKSGHVTRERRNSLDRTKPASAKIEKTSNEQKQKSRDGQSGVNQMRTERLANALKVWDSFTLHSCICVSIFQKWTG